MQFVRILKKDMFRERISKINLSKSPIWFAPDGAFAVPGCAKNKENEKIFQKYNKCSKNTVRYSHKTLRIVEFLH